MAKKRKATPAAKKPEVILRDDVRAAIERVWPGCVVEMAFDSEESYFRDSQERLARDLSGIRDARLVRQLEAEPEEFPSDGAGTSRSYHLFFVCPRDDAFTFEVSTGTYGEFLSEESEQAGWKEMPMSDVSGKGHTGWAVAVSLLAPFAVIHLSEMTFFEDGSVSEPQLEMLIEVDGKLISLEEHFRGLVDEHDFAVLLQLRETISGILNQHGITVLPEQEWQKPVSRLRADPGVLVGASGEPLRVLDAFFFGGI